MKKIALVRLTVCLVLAIVLVVSGLTLADTASETIRKAEQHFEKANELLKRMDYQGAIAEYSNVINLSPGSKVAQDAQYWIGQAHFRAGQFDAAQETFAKLIEEYPTSAIVPVTKQMMEQVEQAKKEELTRSATSDAAIITDPNTDLRFRKIAGLVDEPANLRYGPTLSPNGKFMLAMGGMQVVPVEGGKPFNLVDFAAHRGTWSPDGQKIAFYSGGIWVIPVSPDTARPTGPPKKLIEGDYWGQARVAWSPDSQKFAYRSLTRDRRLWVFSLQDNSKVQITDESVWGRPSWSPDGKWIADIKADKHLWLFLFPVKVGTARNLVPVELEANTCPNWSPDGNWIFWQKDQELHFVRVADALTVNVNLPEKVGAYLSCSSDGKKILFYQTAYDWKISLKVVPASGGPFRDPLKDRLYSGIQQRWTTDGKFVATYDWERYWVVPTAGGEPFPLELNVQVQGKIVPESISPDGKKLLFVTATDGKKEHYKEHYLVAISLEQGSTTGTPVKVFDKPIAWDGWTPIVKWTADGSKLAFICEGDIWIANVDGSPPVQITETPEPEHAPSWACDGKAITWVSSKESALYFCELPGGEPKKLIEGRHWSCKLSDNGTKIAYTIRDGEKTVVFVMSIPGGEAKKLMEVERGHPKVLNYQVSPNGQELAVVLESKILVFSLPDGERREITKVGGPALGRYSSINWSPDGQTLALLVYPKPEKGGQTRIFTVPARGGKWIELAADDPGHKYDLLDWSPDGKWIAYRSDGEAKIGPESVIWEADFEEILKKASH